MAKAMRILENPAEMKRWLTENFGGLKVEEEGPGVFVTTAKENLRISDGRLLRRIEGDGKTAEQSIRDFYGIVMGVKPDQQLVLGEKAEKRFALDTKTLILKHIMN